MAKIQHILSVRILPAFDHLLACTMAISKMDRYQKTKTKTKTKTEKKEERGYIFRKEQNNISNKWNKISFEQNI